MALNPNEAPEGYVAVDDNNYLIGCSTCALEYGSPVCMSVPCVGTDRKDGHFVIFVKRDGKATANLPCDDIGTPAGVTQ